MGGTMATQLTKDTFDQKVLKSELPSLVDFWAPWCGPCRTLGPIIDKLAEGYVNKANVYKVNVDENPELAERFGIRSIPTVLTFKDGKLSKTLVGVQNEQVYQDAIL